MTALALSAADKIGLHKIIDFYKKLDAHFKAQAMKKKTQKELSCLSDHELKDIGLHRSMVGPAAWEAYRIELERQLGGRL